MKSREQSWEPQDFVALSGVCGSADWGAWLGTALGRAPWERPRGGTTVKEPWAGPAWGCRRGQGSVTGTGYPQGEEWHTGWRPRSRLPFPSAEALGQLLSDTRDIVALTSAQCWPLETRSSVGFALRRALRGGAALPLSPEGLAEDGAAARSHEWTEAVCAEAVASWLHGGSPRGALGQPAAAGAPSGLTRLPSPPP